MPSSFRSARHLAAILVVYNIAGAQEPMEYRPADSSLTGPLISAQTGMETAWDIPRSPLSDSLPPDTHLARQILLGYRIFKNTPLEARRFTGNRLSCNNCHLNAGQREKAMPLVGVAGVFPEYNKRAGRLFSLEDRIVGCFLRSEDALGANGQKKDGKITFTGDESVVPATSDEVLALAAYISWISSGYQLGSSISWRGQNTIPPEKIIPLSKLKPKLGEMIYKEKCVTCHGNDGQGVEIGDKKPGPLWGRYSWNDGAGAARIYTLAGMILYMMPYLDPGGLTEEEAQQVAAYINSKPRPVFPFKYKDYAKEKIPPDAVYYKRKGPGE